MDPATVAPLLSILTSKSIGSVSTAARTQSRHFPYRLYGDPRVHLGGALLAVAEHDRHLLHAVTGPDRTVRELDLEAVAVGVSLAEVDPLQCLPPEALEAAREVAHGNPQHHPRVPGTATREQPPEHAPIGHAAAG